MKTDRTVKVAFIDDGIDPGFVPTGIPLCSYVADEQGVRPTTPEKGLTHGSVCFQIFGSNTRATYSLISIKALDHSTGLGNHKALVSALKWCAGQDIDIINMSMGSRQYTDFSAIGDAVGRLSNSIVIAACSNENELTFPACLPTVIGVRHCNVSMPAGSYIYITDPYDQIEVQANAADLPISFEDGEIRPVGGSNSHAAPLITARVCDYLYEGVATSAIRDRLKAESYPGTVAAGYGFYKNLFMKWEKPEIPVVAVSTAAGIDLPCHNQYESPVACMPSCPKSESEDKALINLKALLSEFIKDGYRAVCLSSSLETSPPDFIYSLHRHKMGQLSAHDLIELYYNFTLPDILFLHQEIAETMALPENLQADLILAAPDSNELYETQTIRVEGSAKELFSQICKCLS